jgi:hypothetical protein
VVIFGHSGGRAGTYAAAALLRRDEELIVNLLRKPKFRQSILIVVLQRPEV